MENNNQNLNSEYLEWLKSFVMQGKYGRHKYNDFLNLLHEIDFIYCIPMDENREIDGMNLRGRFLYEHNYKEENMIYLEHPCSVLEMMVALTLRCEEELAWDPYEYGDRTGQWFWKMVSNIGLSGRIDDANFDSAFVRNKISKCLERNYQANGRGGFFIVQKAPQDMRDVDIWTQANWYLDTVLFNDEEN